MNHNLTQNQAKRVELAQEVLCLLDTKQINARRGFYCATTLPTTLPICQTCAVGALIVAAYGAEDVAYGADTIISMLSAYFEPIQLALIETAYEGLEKNEAIRYNLSIDETASEFIAARKMFFWQNSESALRKIMANIIENNGTFVVQ